MIPLLNYVYSPARRMLSATPQPQQGAVDSTPAHREICSDKIAGMAHIAVLYKQMEAFYSGLSASGTSNSFTVGRISFSSKAESRSILLCR